MDNLLPIKEFKYYLTYQTVRTELIYAPNGWDTDTIGSFKRDDYYGGIIRTLALPIKFVRDAHAILLPAWLNDGIEANVLFETEQLDHATFTYLPLWSSNLDFSQWEDDGISCTAILLEAGITSTIKAMETTKFEYPLTSTTITYPDVVNISVPGVSFSEKGDFIFGNISSSDRFIPSLNLVNNSALSGYVTLNGNGQQENITDEGPTFGTSNSWFIKGNRATAIPIHIVGNIKGQSQGFFTTGVPINFTILVKNSNNVTVQTLYTSPLYSVSGVTPFNIPFDFTTSLPLTERLFFYIRCSAIQTYFRVLVTDGDLSASYTQVSDPSLVKGISAANLFKRIIAKISPTQSVASSLLDTTWKNLIITCGNELKQMDNPVIQTSLRDFFDTFNGLDTIGMGIEAGVLKLEQRPYFFKNVLVDTFTGVKACAFTVDTGLIFNTVQIGYNDGNTLDLDGQYEYNSQQQWTLPITRIQREQNWVCIYRADQYGIEKLRVDLVKKTNDTSSDTDVFMFYCDDPDVNGVYTPSLQALSTTVQGLASLDAQRSAYNLEITPKHNLLRHGSYLSSILDKQGNGNIIFASAEKNSNIIISNLVFPTFTENLYINVSAELTGKYFKPYIATITAKLPKGFMARMTANQFGCIQWDWKGKTYKGYILELGVDLAKNTERQIKLLLTSDTNY